LEKNLEEILLTQNLEKKQKVDLKFIEEKIKFAKNKIIEHLL
jgi:hypothetical protein